ncbi:MAG: OmpH family outer membrane protein [Wenzhouxiangella sp.]|nr:MAG: OmpH family outer membrane protein [Wenzhouxiangella sp.]
MPGPTHAKLTAPSKGSWAAAVLLLATFGLVLVTDSATADTTRIGYVDMKRLFDSAPQVVAAREALDREFRPRNETLIADESRLQEMQESLADNPDLSPEDRFELEREVRNLRRSIDRRREDMREELRFRTSTATKALEETIEVAVRQVAEQRGYDLILTSPVAYAAPGIDITDRILEWLADDFSSRNNTP